MLYLKPDPASPECLETIHKKELERSKLFWELHKVFLFGYLFDFYLTVSENASGCDEVNSRQIKEHSNPGDIMAENSELDDMNGYELDNKLVPINEEDCPNTQRQTIHPLCAVKVLLLPESEKSLKWKVILSVR